MKLAKKSKRIDAFNGFTLIELMITISIAAILVGLAVPSFGSLIEKNQITTAHNDLISALKLARNSAITHSKDTYVCELQNKNQCNTSRPFNADWSKGWLVFVDDNGNRKLDNDDLIQLISRKPEKTDTAIVFNQRGRLRFRSDGSSRSAGFYLCNQTEKRHIYLLYSGRTRSNETLSDKQLQTCRKKL